MNVLPLADPSVQFPKDFVWGVATSSFQIEGDASEDGKGASIWDTSCRVPGAIADYSDGDVACDHYHRWADDLDLIAGLGVDAYRFSVSWPRVRLGDRVASITTYNEPWVTAVLGYQTGLFAPGIKNRAMAMQASYHLLLSHGLALQALGAQCCTARLGIVLHLSPVHAATDSQEDRAKTQLEDVRLLRWYLDPLFVARYPQDVLDDLGVDAPPVEPCDLQVIAAPMDLLGINFHSRSVVSAGQRGACSTTSSELRATRSASASCMSTTTPSSAR